MKTKLFLLSLFGALLAHAQSLHFQKLAHMSAGRGAAASVIVNDNIYISNGYTEKGDDRSVEKYNITDNRWSVFNTTLTSKRFSSSEAYNNKIYIFNGLGNCHLEILDLATNTITDGAVNPNYAGSSGSAIHNDKIYVFGGSGLNGAPIYSDQFQYYDIASDTWNPLPDMPTAKETKGKIVNNKLYVIGGFNGTSSNLIDVFDLDTNRWTHQYKMPVGVSGHSLAVADSKIFIVGDYDNQSFLAYFDTVTHQFRQISSNMLPRRHATAEVYDNKLYIMGGNTTSLPSSSIGSTQVADLNELAINLNIPLSP
ncbi:Kelch repeat-containing protein [Chryseobacterium arthrosphaerae]|uniref:Kelch repeat-containing protein n=1 Tax=Chryseobacterium arthrosphaerae TaxID=651561 RepID=UPI003D335252